MNKFAAIANRIALLSLVQIVIPSAAPAVEMTENVSSVGDWMEQVENLIVAASKKEEKLFDAPLSASVLTREEILRSGVTSIQEAFRLIPGFIVREQTNGNYDIQLRGMDSIPRGNNQFSSANTTTLVMIDNRVVYSYFQGGTLWEALPIGLDDVEKIEVIRGPAAALYGPNAVSGVVNIITRREKKDGFTVSALAMQGTHRSTIADVSVGYGEAKKWRIRASGNVETRNRKSTGYFDFRTQTYKDDPRQVLGRYGSGTSYSRNFANPEERYPNRERALDSLGANLYFDYQWSPDYSLETSTGYRYAWAQKAYYENMGTPLSTSKSYSRYANVKLEIMKTRLHFSVDNGRDDPLGLDMKEFYLVPPDFHQEFGQALPDSNFFTFNHTSLDADIEREFRIGNLTLLPGISGRKIFINCSGMEGTPSISNLAISLRADTKIENWRLIAALRADKYDVPKKPYQSYQLGISRPLGDNHLFRLVYSRANKTPSFVEAFTDIIVPLPVIRGGFPVIGVNIFKGNRELELATMDMVEFGHRVKLSRTLSTDSELFFAITRNFSGFNFSTGPLNMVTASGYPEIPVYNQVAAVADGRQIGFTSSVTFQPSHPLSLQTYATLQKTDQRLGSGEWTKSPSTPALFGGINMNYRFLQRWNLNLNPYFTTASSYLYGMTKPAPLSGTTEDFGYNVPTEIPGKFLLNAKVSYQFVTGGEVFVTARNMLNRRSFEYANTDEAGSAYFVGANFEM